MDYNNIPTGLQVSTQLPLDAKSFIKNEASLKDLGLGDNLAFKYHKGLEVKCLEESSTYIWEESTLGVGTKLMAVDFIYPAGLSPIMEIDYSGKAYNFFKIEQVVPVTNTYGVDNIGTGISIYKDSTIAANDTKFNLKKVAALDGSIEITEAGNTILFKSTASGTSEITNPQKRISGAAYTLLAEDFGVSLIVDNAGIGTEMEIIIPINLPPNFITYLVQMGEGNVIVYREDPSNQTINTPIGRTIKGKFYHIAIERILNTQEYNILGNTKNTDE